jgi:hypothetical protein
MVLDLTPEFLNLLGGLLFGEGFFHPLFAPHFRKEKQGKQWDEYATSL